MSTKAVPLLWSIRRAQWLAGRAALGCADGGEGLDRLAAELSDCLHGLADRQHGGEGVVLWNVQQRAQRRLLAGQYRRDMSAVASCSGRQQDGVSKGVDRRPRRDADPPN